MPVVHLVLSNLKTWLNGIHRGVSAKHLQAYLNEFTFRFNRRFNPLNAVRSLLGGGDDLSDLAPRGPRPAKPPIITSPIWTESEALTRFTALRIGDASTDRHLTVRVRGMTMEKYRRFCSKARRLARA